MKIYHSYTKAPTPENSSASNPPLPKNSSAQKHKYISTTLNKTKLKRI